MKLVFLFGSAAVGKMTVGQELMKIIAWKACRENWPFRII